jgi:hypothetical protein
LGLDPTGKLELRDKIIQNVSYKALITIHSEGGDEISKLHELDKDKVVHRHLVVEGSRTVSSE